MKIADKIFVGGVLLVLIIGLLKFIFDIEPTWLASIAAGLLMASTVAD